MNREQKKIQAQVNGEILKAIDVFDKYNVNGLKGDISRLRCCTAWVYTSPRYRTLVSYRTIVAFIDLENGTGYDILRYVYGYTSTSAQHISKFFHDYAAQRIMRYYEI